MFVVLAKKKIYYSSWEAVRQVLFWRCLSTSVIFPLFFISSLQKKALRYNMNPREEHGVWLIIIIIIIYPKNVLLFCDEIVCFKAAEIKFHSPPLCWVGITKYQHVKLHKSTVCGHHFVISGFSCYILINKCIKSSNYKPWIMCNANFFFF